MTAPRTPLSRRRVCIIYHYFAHYRGPVIDELVRNGKHEYHFAADTTSAHTRIKLADNIPPDRWHYVPAFYREPIVFQPRAIRLALSRKFDDIIFLGVVYWPSTWIATALARLTGKRVFFWSHGWTENEGGLKHHVRKAFYRLASGMMLYGHWAKAIGMLKGFRPDKLHVIYNSLDYPLQARARQAVAPERAADVRREVAGDCPDPIVTTIIRLFPLKKVDMLIEAAAMAAKKGRPLTLLIVGDGPDRERLEKLAADRGVRAHFAGAVYDEQRIAELLAISDAACIPGPAGLTVMHALSHGVPFVTNDDFDTQMPEIEAIIPGKTGMFFRAGSTESLCDALLATIGDENLRAYTKAHSIKIIERFYTPAAQRECIDRAIDGYPADDLWRAWRSLDESPAQEPPR
jgi:glycosyltransferase involved in cell wall biosynthesis